MNDWINSWNAIYENIEKKWAFMSEVEQEKQVAYLEETAGMLLDKWTELDEKIHELKDPKHDNITFSYFSKGTTFYELEMFEQAARTLKKEKIKGPNDELRRLYLGFAYLFSEQLSDAKETFLFVIQVSQYPSLKHFAHVGLGCVLTREERLDEAIVSFEHANELTSSLDVVYNLGICYYFNEVFHIAKQYLSTYIQQVPDDGEAYFFLGCCHWQEGNTNEAWTSWTTSISLLDSKESLLALAYVCEWHGYHQAAIHCYKRVQEKHTRSVQTLHGLAWNYALLDDKENALSMFHEALQMEPDNESIRFSLIWLKKSWPEILELQLVDESCN
ncbi:tetratricopeptide repeat protein [Alkalihalobacillus sp. MEB130]|uniref:tetratricopeptide repeat protein n=1 Tax=Alkalihalobacillus sp. MEB130 TaxID=2976704 RepID=UPI0028DD516D|nr:tetratricopeptide repeat protein [Alkalihalobacillus sp. MEB130]MDT8859979.1 tetratricopeptide repeat protein [Alkalihalobacillus sp. MEB130]